MRGCCEILLENKFAQLWIKGQVGLDLDSNNQNTSN